MPGPRQSSGGKAEWSTTSGVAGFADIPEVRVWTLNPAPEAKEYASSSTAGAKRRLGGNDDFSGSISVYVDADNRFDSDLGIKGGETGWFKLYEDATNFFVAPAYIDDVDYTVDIEGGELVEAEISFSSNGAVVYPT
jgi:hypothetical protein